MALKNHLASELLKKNASSSPSNDKISKTVDCLTDLIKSNKKCLNNQPVHACALLKIISARVQDDNVKTLAQRLTQKIEWKHKGFNFLLNHHKLDIQ